MKRRGFSLIEVIGAIIILGIISLIAFVVYTRSLVKFKEDYYTSITRTLKAGGEEFFGDNPKYRPEGILEAKTVSLSTLEEMAYVKKVKDYRGQKCDDKSYVITIRKSESEYIYHTCLSCSFDSYDNTKDKYCDISWKDSTTIDKGIGKLEDIYIYLGTDKEELRELLKVAVSAVKKDYSGKILETAELLGKSEQIMPENMDIVDVTKIGSYNLKYKYRDYESIRKVIVYKNEKPKISIKALNSYAINISGGTTGVLREDYVDGKWNQGLEVLFNPGEGKYEESKTEVAKYQMYSKGEWKDICIIGGNRECKYTFSNEMNEKIKFRILDTSGKISEETGFYDFKIDNTKPTCELKLEGTIQENNWYITPVKITFSVNKDELRGVAEAVSGIKISNIRQNSFSRTSSNLEHTHNEDTNTIEYQGYTEDQAGNFAICRASFKKDGTFPTCTGPSGTSTAWINSSRTISWGCADNLSGCAAGHSGGSETFGKDNVTYKVVDIAPYDIKDEAGNKTHCVSKKADVYVDRILPKCIEGGDSTTYTSGTRKITYGCEDDLNGSGCVPLSTLGYTGYVDFPTTTVTSQIPKYTIKDIANNTVECPARTANVYVDTTKPTCSLTATGTEGENNWYISSNVVINATFNDGNSGVSSKGTATGGTNYNGSTSYTLSSNTTGTTVNCYVKDAVGNTGSNSITIKKDDASNMGACTLSGNSTWTNSQGITARMRFANAPVSGCVGSSLIGHSIDSSCNQSYEITTPDNTILSSGTIPTTSGTTISGASWTCNGGTVTTNIDRTKPTISCTKGSATTSTSGISISCTCSDTGSGVPSGNCPTGNYKDGTHTLTVTDGAGNSTSTTVTVYKRTVNTTCKTCKRCSDAGCETYNVGTCTEEKDYCYSCPAGYTTTSALDSYCNPACPSGTCKKCTKSYECNTSCETYSASCSKCGCSVYNTATEYY